MIRRANSSDIDRIVELGWRNVEPGAYRDLIEFDERKVRMFVGAILGDEKARFLVWDERGSVVGMFAFTTFHNFYYFAGRLVANMVIWSVAPEHRGRTSLKLLQAAETEARMMGAKYMLLTGPSGKFDKLSRHCKYDYMEASYIKGLN